MHRFPRTLLALILSATHLHAQQPSSENFKNIMTCYSIKDGKKITFQGQLDRNGKFTSKVTMFKNYDQQDTGTFELIETVYFRATRGKSKNDEKIFKASRLVDNCYPKHCGGQFGQTEEDSITFFYNLEKNQAHGDYSDLDYHNEQNGFKFHSCQIESKNFFTFLNYKLF